MWKWFKSTVDKTIVDKFRIKVIILKDGTKKYFPQYKEDTLSSEWLVILSLTSNNVFYFMDSFELLTTDNYEISEENARKVIEQTKLELSTKRAKDFLSEEIIKID